MVVPPPRNVVVVLLVSMMHYFYFTGGVSSLTVEKDSGSMGFAVLPFTIIIILDHVHAETMSRLSFF